MKKTTFIIIAAILCVSAMGTLFAMGQPPSTGIVYEGGDGSSMEKAVVIKGASNSDEGIKAEDLWMEKMHPGWTKKRQSLMYDKKGNFYDAIQYATPKGSRTIYFNITAFFKIGP